MPAQTVETLEEIRNRLLSESRKQKDDEKPGYINGVLDFYLEAKKIFYMLYPIFFLCPK